MSRVKGSNILNHVAFITSRYGESARARLMDALTPSDVEQLSPRILASSWYSFGLYNRIDAAICDLFAGGDTAICREIGADSAHRALSGTYRAFLKEGPAALLQRLAGLHGTFYEAGCMDVAILSARQAVIRNVYVPHSTRTNCLVAEGFYGTAVEICGGRDVQVTEGGCSADGASHCLFNVCWN